MKRRPPRRSTGSQYNGPMMSEPDPLPTDIYSAGQVRLIDRVAIDELGIPGYELMCRAGTAALAELRKRWPDARRIAVFCGAGNNAGDGYVVARLARAAGLDVHVVAVVPPERLRGDAAQAWADCRAAGIDAVPFGGPGAAGPLEADVVVDALLGTGLDRPVEGAFAEAIAAMNARSVPILALDVPSGLDADTGRVLGVAVRADATITFVGLKQGLFLGEAPDYRGALAFADLDIPAVARQRFRPALTRLSLRELEAALPKRPRSAHKGTNGRLLLVGGAPGMSGAIRLAAEAALRVGAGLVYVATHPVSLLPVMSGRPELMCRAVETADALDSLLELADAVVLGPGLGRDAWGRALWQRVIATDLPLVVDADGLNLLAERSTPRGRWIVTPHPAEAGRLLGIGTAEVQADRLAAVRELSRKLDAIAVLKGACSLVCAGEQVAVCDRGNPGMATGGTGDVLAGVLGGLAVQLRDLPTAARVGVLLHALAGDDAARDGERGMIASDLLAALRRRANPV